MAITEMVNERFGTNLVRNQVYIAMKNRKIKNGIDPRFKPGTTGPTKGMKFPNRRSPKHKPGWNNAQTKPIGSETVRFDGYTWVKIGQPNTWRQKHQVIWEKENGPIPTSSVVIFGDGDKTNFDLDNLLMVKRKQLVRMNKAGLIFDNTEATKSGVIMADIMNKVGKLKKKYNIRSRTI